LRRLPLALIFAGFVIAAAADAWFLGGENHGEFWWSQVYGFFALFGFIGCLAIVLLGDLILGPWLQRKQNYYRREASP
jgi:hypothetical protein